jgi:hypothetical protein
MKRIILTLIIAAFAITLSGQKDALDDFFNSYSDKEGYTFVTISGNLFGLLKNLDDDPDLEGLDQKITSVRIVSREGDSDFFGPDFYSELKGIIRRGGYEELMKVKNPDENLLFLVRTDRDVIKELLMVASGDTETVIQVRGNFTKDDVDRFTEDEGLAELEMLEFSGKW